MIWIRMYMCTTESRCYTAEISTTLWINYTSTKQIKKTNYLKKTGIPLHPTLKTVNWQYILLSFFPQRTNAHALWQAQEFLGLRGGQGQECRVKLTFSLVLIILQPFSQPLWPSAGNCLLATTNKRGEFWVGHIPWWRRPGFLSPGTISFSIFLSGHLYSLGVEVEAKRAERGRALRRVTEDEPWAWSQSPALTLLSLWPWTCPLIYLSFCFFSYKTRLTLHLSKDYWDITKPET